MNAIGRASVAMMMSFLLLSCSKEGKKKEMAPVKVDVLTIKASSEFQSLSYSGFIEPENTAAIGFSVPGVVETILAEEGQRVKQGQLLATIDATEYINALAIANAGLEQAEDMFTRLNTLYEKGSLPAREYIDIKTKVAQAKANQAINAKRINDSKLVAPITGIVTSRKIERGSMAAPGSPAFAIVKTDKVYTRISVPESEVGSLRDGMETRVYIPTLRDTLSGRITIVNPQADEVSRTYTVKIKLDNAAGKILPGMITRVEVPIANAIPAMRVPATAIVRDADDITYLYVVNENSTAMKKRVTVKSVLANNQVIIDGLQWGDRVIVAGQSRLKDGSRLAL